MADEIHRKHEVIGDAQCVRFSRNVFREMKREHKYLTYMHRSCGNEWYSIVREKECSSEANDASGGPVKGTHKRVSPAKSHQIVKMKMVRN